MQLKKIKVYGKLRQFLGQSTFEAAVKSPQQAVNFLRANYAGIDKHMNDQIYKVKMGGRVITKEYLSMSGQGDIEIIPIACGAAHVVFGFLATGFAAEAGILVGGGIIGSIVSFGLKTVGQSMIFGGVSNLLGLNDQNSIPIDSIDPNIRNSYNFSGIQNISTTGIPVPILYGLVYSGSVIISSGVDTAQIVKALPVTPPPRPEL